MPPSDGRTVVDGREREFFAEHGWLVLRRAVTAERAAELVRALDAVVPEASYPVWGDRVVEIASISRGSAEIARHAHDPALAGWAAAVLGAERIQLLQDTALVKPAASPARVEWHQDYSYLGYLDRPSVVTARLALTPCTTEGGCMRVIDGSHRWGLQGSDLSFRRDDVADTLAGLPAERARGAEVELTLEPGDVSLHHCLTFHASGTNRAARPRKTLIVRLMDGACRLVAERLPSPEAAAYFPSEPDGALAATAFPVVWPLPRKS